MELLNRNDKPASGNWIGDSIGVFKSELRRRKENPRIETRRWGSRLVRYL